MSIRSPWSPATPREPEISTAGWTVVDRVRSLISNSRHTAAAAQHVQTSPKTWWDILNEVSKDTFQHGFHPTVAPDYVVIDGVKVFQSPRLAGTDAIILTTITGETYNG